MVRQISIFKYSKDLQRQAIQNSLLLNRSSIEIITQAKRVLLIRNIL